MKNKKVANSVQSHVNLPSEINYALFEEIMTTLEGVQKSQKKKFTPERLAKEVYGVTFLNFHLLYWEEKSERVRLEQQAIERVGQIDKLERENSKLRQEVELYKRSGVQEESISDLVQKIREIPVDSASGDLRQP